MSTDICPGILHIANWYPNPWDAVEGNFVREQIRVFKEVRPAETIVVQVRASAGHWLRLDRVTLDDGERGYFLHAPVRPGKVMEWLSTLLLTCVLLKERAWRYDALHVHIAYPLLLHTWLWRWMFRSQILISEHWSAYHYNFNLPAKSKALSILRKPFRRGDPVFAVSASLLEDIRKFSLTNNFLGFVIPNVVPLHGSRGSHGRHSSSPVFFAVNRWVPIKNPVPMLEGLNKAVQAGCDFRLVIGGYGEMVEAMSAYVGSSALQALTIFTGKMTKPEIAEQLAKSDGYLFSSDYETFSVACAEALGAGVPLIGPHIAAIAEYAGPDDWEKVETRTAEGWQTAIQHFLEKREAGRWNSDEIAQRAADRFSDAALSSHYLAAMQALGLGRVK